MVYLTKRKGLFFKTFRSGFWRKRPRNEKGKSLPWPPLLSDLRWLIPRPSDFSSPPNIRVSWMRPTTIVIAIIAPPSHPLPSLLLPRRCSVPLFTPLLPLLLPLLHGPALPCLSPLLPSLLYPPLTPTMTRAIPSPPPSLLLPPLYLLPFPRNFFLFLLSLSTPMTTTTKGQAITRRLFSTSGRRIPS